MASPTHIKRVAADLIDTADMTPPIDVEALARAEGAVIVREHFENNVSGMLLREESAIILAVNAAHHIRRQRFTIAHEIGHLLLHPGRARTVDSSVRINWRNDISSLASSREEMDANAFAANLLMPETAVRQVVEALREASSTNASQVVEDLADRFDVSSEAMGYRLINLGIAT